MSHTSGTAANYRELLDALDTFLTATGHAWGKSFSGTGDGDLVDAIGTAASVAETFTITFTDATNFTVSGSTTGALAAGVVGTPYTSAVIEFTINAGATPFAAGDVFTIQTTPKWARTRAAGCADSAKRTSDMVNLENALDDDIANLATRAATTCFVEWEMHRAVEIRAFRLRCWDNALAPASFDLQYSDTAGGPWTTAESWIGQTWDQDHLSRDYTLAAAPGAHTYWRLQVNSSTGASLQIRTILLFEHVGDAYSLSEHFEIIWQAPGVDGAQEINIGCRTYGRTDTDTFNLAFNMWRQTDAAAPIADQPNACTPRSLSLIDSPIGYWIIANGQRFVVVAKFASLYQFAYAGFGNPYETPSVHPYPAFVGASYNDITLRYNSVLGAFRFPADPGLGACAFYPDGQWRDHRNRDNGSNSEGNNSGADGRVWPSDLSDASGVQPSNYRENLDDSRPLLPIVLWHQANPVHAWGELDGVYWTTGFGTVAEALIAEEGFDHLVVNNIFRNGVQHYAALRLD